MKYFKDHYDVIVIGAALAGLTCAIDLAREGKDVLVLERHNLPGGICTSFVRNGIEIEATLHELYNVGSEETPYLLRKYFNEIGLPICWKKIPETYRFKDKNTDISLGTSYEEAARAIDKIYPGNYDKVMEFYALCHRVNMSAKALETGMPKGNEIITEHADFFRTIGYTMDEVLDSFGFSKEVKEILSVYWIYLGTPPKIIPFTILGIVIDEYMDRSPYIPEHKSYEMGLKLSEYATSLGIQIEYGQEVSKINVSKNTATGVTLASGEVIHSDYVVSGAYPQTVYSRMIEPKEAVPKKALKYATSRNVNVSGISIQLLLEGKPEDYNITTYTVFMTPEEMDSEKAYENMNTMGPYQFMALVCYNKADDKVSPEGTTLVDISVMPRIDAWDSITPETYFKVKRKVAREIISTAEKCLDTDFFSHIIDIFYETPVTFAHYAKAYKGAVYGFDHTMDDHFIVRYIFGKDDEFIKHLYFAGAHSRNGDGEATQFANGKSTAETMIKAMRKEEKHHER